MKILQRTLRNHVLTKGLVVICLSNFVCMVVLNLFSLKPARILFLYPILLVLSAVFVWPAKVKRTEFKITRTHLFLAFLYLALLNAPRVSYPLERLFSGTVPALGDDYHRIAELISLTLSDHYPARHYLNQGFLLSFYYCAFMPFVFLKFLIPALTLKETIFIGNVIYSTLIVFGLLEMFNLLFSDRRQITVCFLFCTFLSGLDWLFYPHYVIGHYEWWGLKVFHDKCQISSFYTCLFYAIHHFLGYYLALSVFVIVRYYRFPCDWMKYLTAWLLLGSSFFSSVFATLPTLLFFTVERRIVFRRIIRHKGAFLFAIALGSTLVFIFLGQSSTHGFRPSEVRLDLTGSYVLNRILSFPVYMLVVCLVDLLGIPLFLLFQMRRMKDREMRYLGAAFAYLASTYFIAFSGANNYSMRGMLLPTMVFYYLFSKHLYVGHEGTGRLFVRRLLVGLLIISGSVGFVKEFGYHIHRVESNFWKAKEGIGKEWRDLLDKRDLRHLPAQSAEKKGFLYAEKMVIGKDPEMMATKDRELLGRPVSSVPEKKRP